MQYVNYGKTGLKVSRFGLGCMRFPEDEKKAIEMVRYALDNGVTYTDTAFVYANSEVILGKALSDGYRNKTALVTKSPLWIVENHNDFETYLDEELKRLKTDHIDVYLMHNLYPDNWERVKKYDGLSFLDKMIKKGKILHKGFSIHNTTAAFKEIADSFDWDMAQQQLNILDEHQQVGVEGLKYGAQKGLAMVIMEPLRGGAILNAPKEVLEIVNAYPDKRPLVEWCFRWLYNKEEISVILSGTNTLEQLKENLKIFENAAPNVMTKEEDELIKKLQAAYIKHNTVGCTGCRYCMPCPKGVQIPDIFKTYNNYKISESRIDAIYYQKTLMDLGKGADQCISCGQCKKKCPQTLDIPTKLKEAHECFMEVQMPAHTRPL
ncbi:MAG: aldo/keto reductase [Endomicrobium sp.]|jgi:predicted aldo/keto reductase-like oxidoreductase|nr:aldo/keto reductase [Endomicrobium sp.]